MKHHVCIAPYLDACGNKRASYCDVNQWGKAIGTVSIQNGIVDRVLSVQPCDEKELVRLSLEHFNQTEPVRFAPNL